MLKKFRVKNFLCLKDVTVDLAPLTVLIGPNSSGKSALFRAIVTFCRLLWYPVRGGPMGDFNVEPGITLDDAVWNGDTALPIIFEAWLDNADADEPEYILELRRGYPGWSIVRERFFFQDRWLDTSQEEFVLETSQRERSWSAPNRSTLAYLTKPYATDNVAGSVIKPIQELRTLIGSARRYRPSASDIASFVKPQAKRFPSPKKIVREIDVDQSGQGLARVLQDVWRSDRPTFEAIEKGLQALHSHILGIDFIQDWRGIGLAYKTNRSKWNVPANLESDGVLLSTFLTLEDAYSTPQFQTVLRRAGEWCSFISFETALSAVKRVYHYKGEWPSYADPCSNTLTRFLECD